jgi:hypothetical protein
MTKHRLIRACLVGLLLGCGGGGQVRPAPPAAAPAGPDWINKGSGAFSSDAGKVLRGVGVASGIRNVALLRTAADDRARTEIAKVLDTYVSVLNKDYQASTTAGDMKSSSEEQHVSQAMKTFSQAELQGVRIAERYLGADGTQYALAQLDLQQVKDGLSKMRELNERVRNAVRANADKAFDELDTQGNAAARTPAALPVAQQPAPPPAGPPPSVPARDPAPPSAPREPPPAQAPPPPQNGCLAQDDASPLVRGCVVAIQANEQAVVVTVQLVNKLDRPLAVIADARHLACGAELTDRRGNSYTHQPHCPGSLPFLNADPGNSGTAALVIRAGQPMRGKLPVQRQYVFNPVRAYREPESWTMELDLFVTNPERSEDSKIDQVQLAFQNISRSK